MVAMEVSFCGRPFRKSELYAMPSPPCLDGNDNLKRLVRRSLQNYSPLVAIMDLSMPAKSDTSAARHGLGLLQWFPYPYRTSSPLQGAPVGFCACSGEGARRRQGNAVWSWEVFGLGFTV